MRMMLLNQRRSSVHVGPKAKGRAPRCRRVVVLREAGLKRRLNATDCNVTISNATDINTQEQKAGVKFLSRIYGNVR